MRFDKVVGLHAIKELVSVLADGSRMLTGGTGHVALNVEFSLDWSGENGVRGSENSRGDDGGRIDVVGSSGVGRETIEDAIQSRRCVRNS